MTLRFLRVALVLALLPLAACDETSSVATTPEDAIADAAAAGRNGDFERAADILERALDENPDSAPLRVELGRTLLERDGVDILDLDRVASYLVEGEAGGAVAAPASNASKSGSCRFADEPGAVEFDPRGVAGYPDLSAQRATIEYVLALIAPVMPAELQPGSSDAAFCGAIDTSTTPSTFGYDAPAAAAALRALGLSDDQIGALLTTNALARFTLAYLDATEGLDQQTTWYRLADGGIGVCAEDEAALEEDARASVANALESIFSLHLRASVFQPGSASEDLLEVVTDAFEEVRDGFGDYCAEL